METPTSKLATVLLVEDNPTNLKLTADLLEIEGYQVLRAMDAPEALAVLDRTLPDLILMDVQLPGMDGLALAKQLKQSREFGHLPIVALTACALRGDDQKAFDAGCDGYISKPIDTRKLGHQVASYLRGGRARAIALENDVPSPRA